MNYDLLKICLQILGKQLSFNSDAKFFWSPCKIQNWVPSTKILNRSHKTVRLLM